jgi:prevent-host-death family protein
MKTATVSKLKATLSEYLRLVKRGEEVVITERGRPVARIVPIGPKVDRDERLRELVKRGLVRPGRGLRGRSLAHLPIVGVSEGAILKAIDEEREERW